MINIENITIGQLLALVAVIMTVVKAMDWFVDRFITPRLKKDSQIQGIEKQLGEIALKLDRDLTRLNGHDQKIEDLEHRMQTVEKENGDMHDYKRITLQAIQSLLKHNLENGNNIDDMSRSSKDIDDYLHSKI